MSGSDDQDQRDTVVDRRAPPDTVVERPKVHRQKRPSAREDFAESLPTGTVAGRYVLLGRLGAGGAGLVYSAYDPELDRKVAIKLLRGLDGHDTSASQGRTRLLREAQAMARLKHPNILPVYDVGTLEHPLGSRVFMAMELVEGGTLRAWLKERHTRREIVDVMLACGRGLAAAHAAGFVHRDFKPGNVLVDRDGRVFVTDFGLVRAAGLPEQGTDEPTSPPSALAQPLTALGAVMGTPGYMAPEQYRAEPIDARTDQFSYCLTLAEALCGKRMVTGETMQDLETATRDADFAASLRAAKVPSWLARVIVRGLAPDRAARYPTMDALLAALRSDPTKRMRYAAIGGAVAIALAAGTWLTVQAVDRPPAQLCGGADRQLASVWDVSVRDRIRQAFDRAHAGASFPNVAATLDAYAGEFRAAHREACEATRVRGEQPDSVLALRMSCLDTRRKELGAVTSLLATADEPTVLRAQEVASKLTTIRSCADIAALTAPVPPPNDPLARGLVDTMREHVAEAKVFSRAARYPEARAIIEQVLRGERVHPYGPLRAEALEQLAGLEREQDGNMKAARGTLLDAVAAAYASHDDERVASTLTNLAMLDAYWLGEHESGEHWIALAKAAIDRLGGSDELEAERGRVEAEIWIGEQKGDPAVNAADPALRLANKVYGPDSLQAAMFHATLGAAEQKTGNETLAREHYEKQHAILVKLVGADHPMVAMALNNLGLNAEAEGRLGDAERFYRSSVSILEKSLGPDHPRVAIALANLGAALRTDGQNAEALTVLQRSLAINTKHFGDDYPDSLDALLGIGESLVALGRPAEALPMLERALRLTTEGGEPQDWGLAEARFALAEALWDSGGDRTRARKLAADARVGMATVQDEIARHQLTEIDAWIARHR